ncbi:MAG TPA: tetratricopeptide repeat protein [Terriglobales bacterium]|nr:tetratricopeptide repeat protein [Terriglobales bacterium]
MPSFIRSLVFTFLFASIAPLLHAQASYQRFWQYEDRASKLTPEQFTLTTQLAQQGDVEAEMILAAAYRKGIGVEKNSREYLVWLQRAAEHGAPEAQFGLAMTYKRGNELLGADPQQFISWIRRAADQGHMMAMHNLGSYYMEGIPNVLPANTAQGEFWLTRSAESGFTHAQYVLGAVYMEGRQRPTDLPKSEMWLRKATEHGHSLAMALLARLYSSGDGPPRDPDFVERILLRGAEMGRPETQYYLARMYRLGYLGAVNLPHAIEWLQISAGKKYAPSSFMLGEMYEKGEGVPTNAAAAAQYYLEAATLGYTPALCKAAQVYHRGQGVSQDNAAAFRWYLIGSRRGVPECSAGQKKLASELKEKEVQRITEETEAWIQSHPFEMAQPPGKYRYPQGIMVSDDPPPDPSQASTQEEREKMVKLVAALEASPRGDEARKNASWVANWIHDIPDIFFIECSQLLETQKAKSDYVYRKLLEQQMFFSGAAYQVQHLEGKDQLAIYHAGLLGAMRAYEAILAQEPKTRWTVMDGLLERRNSLREFVHQQANKNCR